MPRIKQVSGIPAEFFTLTTSRSIIEYEEFPSSKCITAFFELFLHFKVHSSRFQFQFKRNKRDTSEKRREKKRGKKSSIAVKPESGSGTFQCWSYV
jgi:hypothetical protein